MPYKREAGQLYTAISAAGNNADAVITYNETADAFSGSGGAELSMTVKFVQVNYSARDISDGSVASGLIKILVSPIDGLGVQIPNFTKILKNKTAYVSLNGQAEKISIKLAKITMPDFVTPIVARLFLGG